MPSRNLKVQSDILSHATARHSDSPPQLVVQLGHSDRITSAVFSPDGRFVLSGGADKTVILWETATGRVVRRFVGHTGEIRSVAFSPDGRWILTGAGDSEDRRNIEGDYDARLWDVATGKVVRQFEGHTDGINAVAFSPDGRLALTGSDDETVRLWDAAEGREIRRFVGHASIVRAVSFSPDSRLVLSGGGDLYGGTKGELPDNYTACLWDRETGKVVRRLEGHSSEIGTVAFSPDGRFVLSAERRPNTELYEEKNTVRFWDVSTGKEIDRIDGFSPVILSPDGQFILLGDGESFEAKLWYINQRKDGGQFRNGNDGGIVVSAAISPDGRLALVAFDILQSGGSGGFYSGSASLRLYEVASGKEIRQFTGAATKVMTAVATQDSRLVFAGETFWDLHTGKAIYLDGVFQEHLYSGNIDLRILSQDGRLALTTSTMDSYKSYEEASMVTDSDEGTSERETPVSEYVQVWDTDSGQEIKRWKDDGVFYASFSPNGRSVLTVSREAVRMWEVATGKERWAFKDKYTEFSNAAGSWLSQTHTDGLLSWDGSFVLARTKDDKVAVLQAEDGEVIHEFDLPAGFYPLLLLAPNNRFFMNGEGRLFDVQSGEEIRRFDTDLDVHYAAFSSDSRYLLLGGEEYQPQKHLVQVWDVETGKLAQQFEWIKAQPLVVSHTLFSPDGRYVLKADLESDAATLWDVETGHDVRRFGGHLGIVNAAAFLYEGRFVLTASQDGTTRLWRTETGEEICRLVSFRNGAWAVVTPEGQFDTNNLDDIEGLYWTVADEPMRPLPLEIFLRDYYEPRLLPRLLGGEKLPTVRDLSTLNRVQPIVRIVGITMDSAETVAVSVEVSKAQSEFWKDGQKVLCETSVHDVRLFRDGQLVGYAPGGEMKADPDEIGKGRPFPENLFTTEQGPNIGEIALNPQTGKATLTFQHINLPRLAGVGNVEFSAYAFNDDRVKSVTDRRGFDLPIDLTPLKGRAYVISFGVNAYEREGLNLRYASNDARQMQASLSMRLAAQGEYEEVVSLPLVSDYAVALSDGREVAAQDATLEQVRVGQKRITENSATMAHLRAVLDMLAGRQANVALLQDIPNADKLRAARPEDLVLISASSHGYTDGDGIFYLVPSDTGTAPPASLEFRSHCVSSDELSQWLRDVDAGELVMIVDACHSAAAVKGTDFKPGPMGSRGLGQLSYDKGMRILTATQADNVALEANKVRQGLLIYALLEDGLASWMADYKPRDKTILLTEWLGYGVERVPRLYEEVKGGRIRGTFDPRELEDNKTQQPSLFDFARRRRDVVLARQP